MVRVVVHGAGRFLAERLLMLFWSFGFVAAVATTMLAGRLDRWREAQWATVEATR